jgi:hypothetical protein
MWRYVLRGLSGGCSVYLFSSTDPDKLTLTTLFTGTIQVMIRSTAETGINPVIVSGRQGAFVPNLDPVNNATHTQYEIEAVGLTYIVDETFNGVVVGYAKDDVWTYINTGPYVPVIYDWIDVNGFYMLDVNGFQVTSGE